MEVPSELEWQFTRPTVSASPTASSLKELVCQNKIIHHRLASGINPRNTVDVNPQSTIFYFGLLAK